MDRAEPDITECRERKRIRSRGLEKSDSSCASIEPNRLHNIGPNRAEHHEVWCGGMVTLGLYGGGSGGLFRR